MKDGRFSVLVFLVGNVMSLFNRLLGVAAMFLLCFCTTGCESKPEARNLVDTNIKRVKSLYGIYASSHNFVGPASKEDLLGFFRDDVTAKVKMKRLGIEADTIEDCFVSERDGEPFEIRWGVKGLEDHAIVFEKIGVDGKRMVAFSKPRELDDDDYKAYLKGKKVGQVPESLGP